MSNVNLSLYPVTEATLHIKTYCEYGFGLCEIVLYKTEVWRLGIQCTKWNPNVLHAPDHHTELMRNTLMECNRTAQPAHLNVSH